MDNRISGRISGENFVGKELNEYAEKLSKVLDVIGDKATVAKYYTGSAGCPSRHRSVLNLK